MYRLIRFGTTDLEYTNQVDDIGSGETPTSYFELPEGGALDGFGSQQKNPTIVERVKQLTLSGRTEAAVAAQFYGLMALRGKRDKLYRRTSGGKYHWTYARCKMVPATRDYQRTRFGWLQDVELHFICQDATWRGLYRGSWTLNSGVKLNSGYALNTGEKYNLTASPCALTINGYWSPLETATDAGRDAIRIMQIIVSAGNASMSPITIARTGGESLTYTGTIPSGGQLIINTGTHQVTCTGVSNPYNLLSFTPAADMAAWFTLLAGSNPITVTYTGGGTGKAIEFIFNESQD
jgi:hypothetical protein